MTAKVTPCEISQIVLIGSFLWETCKLKETRIWINTKSRKALIPAYRDPFQGSSLFASIRNR